MLSIVTGQENIGYSLDNEKENCKPIFHSVSGDWPQQLNNELSKEKYVDNNGDEFSKILLTLRQQNVMMDENWLHLTSLASERILLHLDDLVAVESLCEELWQLEKRLKQDMENSGGKIQQQQDVFIKAILVTIYHCRVSIQYNQRDWARVIIDCRKCLSIDLQTDMLMSSDSLLLQKVGLLKENVSFMLEQGLVNESPSSILSGNTVTMMICSFCSLEKRKMPVCAQCKYQSYCGIKCLKQDKARHSTECQRR